MKKQPKAPDVKNTSVHSMVGLKCINSLLL